MDSNNFAPIYWLQKDNTALNAGQAVDPHTPPPLPAEAKKESNSKLPNFTIKRSNRAPAKSPSTPSLNHYFIQGWNGKNLYSKDAKSFQDSLKNIAFNALEQLKSHRRFNTTLREGIFNEFLTYAEFQANNYTQIDTSSKFWQNFDNPKSPHHKEIISFCTILSRRVATIYFFKLRLALKLAENLGRTLSSKELYNPQLLLTEQFLRGSSTDLKSKALRSNIYSWFRPSTTYQEDLKSLFSCAKRLTVGEVVKFTSPFTHAKEQESHCYSHSLSHVNTGLFLNSLLINFPLWLDFSANEKRFTQHPERSAYKPEVVSVKYSGDYLESLSVSHWLGQENNTYLLWDQVLCSDFKGKDFETGSFTKICNELQLITFLINYATEHNIALKKFISWVINNHYQNKKSYPQHQRTFLDDDFSTKHSRYDRVVLNLAQQNKNNPHFYLVHSIQSQLKDLKDNGLIYVFTNNNLFVPSQKQKITQLLEELKLEGFFNLDNIKGKGELSNYVYVFSKRNDNPILKNYEAKKTKESCLTFRVDANLASFQYFCEVTEQLQHFFRKYLNDRPSMYQSEFFHNYRLEFYQDIIFNGRLIHSSSQDNSQITHPQFFKNLLSGSVHFDYFFDIRDMSKETDKKQKNQNLFAFGIDQISLPPYVVVLDQRSDNTKIEIITIESYKSKSYQYGFTQCHYFGITPKHTHYNLDLFRCFFTSALGKQVIELSFTGAQRKLKARLASLLIPKFFTYHNSMPEHIEQGISLWKKEIVELKKLDPSQLKEQFDHSYQLIKPLSKRYPHQLLSELSRFRNNIQELNLDYHNLETLDFSNPALMEKILKLNNKPLYSEGTDIYIDVYLSEELKNPLDAVKTTYRKDTGQHCVDLFTQEQKVLSIYSTINMCRFLNYLFNQMVNYPIYQLVQGIQIPAANDLDEVVTQFLNSKKTIQTIIKSADQQIDQLFYSSITQNK